MKTLFSTMAVLVTLLLFSTSCFAQTQNGILSAQERAFGGYRYAIDGREVSSQEFMERMNVNPEAAKMFKSGKGMATAGTIIGCVGAFGLGFDVGTRIGGGDGNTGLLIGGGAVMAGGLVIYYVGRGKMKKSLNLYHNDRTSANLNLNLSGEGIGFCLNF